MGTKEGGIKAAATNKRRYGDRFYAELGAIGGRAKVPKGFALNKELARLAGQKGGKLKKGKRLKRA